MSLFDKVFGKREQSHGQQGIPPEFAEELNISRAYLNSFTELNQSGWNFGKQKSFQMKQNEGILRFEFEDGSAVECSFQAIGSFSAADNTWAWAWANPSISESLKVDAQRAYEYGREHQITLLTTPEWAADMEWAWTMTAFAARGCQAGGAFCAEMGLMRMFLTFRNVNIIPPTAAT